MKKAYTLSSRLFLKALSKDVLKLVDVKNLKNDQVFLKNITNDLLGLGRTSVSKQLTPKEKFFSQVFRDFYEVLVAYDSLQDIAALAQHWRCKRLPIDKEEYLKKMTEIALNEYYIFHMRIFSFLTRTERSYKKHEKHLELSKNVNALKRVIEKKVSKNIIEIRGGHIHSARYGNNHDKYARVDHLKLLVVAGGLKALKPIYREALNESVAHTRTTIKNINQTAKTVLEAVFKHLNKLLIYRSNLVYPI